MARNISITKKDAMLLGYAIAVVLTVTVSFGAGAAFAFCTFVVLTA